MDYRTIVFPRIGDLGQSTGWGFDHAAVAGLSAAFRIERRLGGDYGDAAVSAGFCGDDFRFAAINMVAKEARRDARINRDLRRSRLVLTGGAPTLTLRLHQAIETFYVSTE